MEERKVNPLIGPTIVTLQQVTLPSRATLPLDAIPGLEMLYIVSGHLTALDAPQASDSTNPLLLAPQPGGHRIANAAVAMGTFRPGRVVSNPAAEPTTMLLVTITTVEPGEAHAT